MIMEKRAKRLNPPQNADEIIRPSANAGCSNPLKWMKTNAPAMRANPTQNNPALLSGRILDVARIKLKITSQRQCKSGPFYFPGVFVRKQKGRNIRAGHPIILMKILSIKPVEHTFAVECHSPEDMVFVATLIHTGDFVSGETDRNIKPREPGQKPFRIKMHITVKANEITVDENTPALRVSGTIEEGSPIEFVEMHAQHALLFNLYQPIRVRKEQLFPHDIARIREREKESQKPLYLGIVLDDEEALVLQVSGSGLKDLGKINSFKSGKQFKNDSKTNAYFEKLAEIIFASPLSTIILAGPGFTREALFTYLRENTPKGKEKTFLSVATADTGQKGIREALSNASISKALGESKISQEAELMHEVLKQLGKDSGLVAYGLEHVERAVHAGAAHTLLLSSSFLSSNREHANKLLESAGRMGIVAHILDEKFDPGKQLAGLSGVAALLRYRFE